MRSAKGFVVAAAVLLCTIGLPLSDLGFISGQLKSSAIAAPTPTKTVTIYADSNLGTPKRFTGFLHGVTYDAGQNYTTTIDLLSMLNPALWRLSNQTNYVYGFVATKAQFPQKYGTLISFVVQDAFNQQYGYPIIVGNCGTAQLNCFATFGDLKYAWNALVDDVMRAVITANLTVHYYDVFAEPDSGWQGVSESQIHELFKAAHDVVRQYQPQAKIVGPSTAIYNKTYLQGFLAYAVANNLRLDALSWHEFGAPDSLPAHVYEMRQYISANPSLCNPACPEIHINEYAGSGNHLIPGWTVGWLQYLEQAAVDQSHRACWAVSGGWSTCWAGFDGMLLQDNVTTQHVFWVYKWHADTLSGTRLNLTTGSSKVVALARKHDSISELNILMGRYDGGTGNVTVKVKSYPYPFTRVNVTVERIPTNANIPSGLIAPILVSSSEVAVVSGSVSSTLTNFKDGEAYIVTLKPVSR